MRKICSHNRPLILYSSWLIGDAYQFYCFATSSAHNLRLTKINHILLYCDYTVGVTLDSKNIAIYNKPTINSLSILSASWQQFMIAFWYYWSSQQHLSLRVLSWVLFSCQKPNGLLWVWPPNEVTNVASTFWFERGSPIWCYIFVDAQIFL